MNDYQERKAFYQTLLTIYGRKPVLEALQDQGIPVHKLHLAHSNRRGGIIADIEALAMQRGVEVQWHDRQALSRISRNGKQDQGVAADLQLPSYRPISQLFDQADNSYTLLAVDRVTNPQNLGMIIRSVAASGIDGLVLPRKGCAALSPLVIKASAGTLFKAPIYHCEQLSKTLQQFKDDGAELSSLSSHAQDTVFDEGGRGGKRIYVLGNETEGVSGDIEALCQRRLRIPMHNGVESLNVAVTAALLAFAVS